jgi:hypothetical protein
MHCAVGSGIGAARCGGLTLRKLIAAVEDKRMGQPGHRKVPYRLIFPNHGEQGSQIRDILVPIWIRIRTFD